jgi:plasmid maintenance system antidote protein VapI
MHRGIGTMMGKKSRSPGIDEQLRDAIRASEMTCYAIGKRAGLRPEHVARFLRAERDIRLGTAAKIARVLGIQLKTSNQDG